MSSSIDLSYGGIIAMYLLLLPILILLWYFKLAIIKDTIISILRMSLQLIFIGIYLKYIFLWNSVIINGAWILIMVLVASFTVLRQAKLPIKSLILATFISISSSAIIILCYFTLFISKQNFSNAAFIIPIAGMLLGNSLRSCVIVVNHFKQQISENRAEYRMRLLFGATEKEAYAPFAQQALKSAISPTIATMATLGLVSLPGMMTGQILGGSAPFNAILYQIAIMIGILAMELTASSLLLNTLAHKIILLTNTLHNGK